MKAMEALDHRLAGHHVGRTAAGAPLWPQGFVGSITHTDDFASAAVALTTDVVALGIDTERVMSEPRAREVGRVIAWPVELVPARAAGLTRLEALTLVFSAKESIFKCVHPRVGRMFAFHDVRLIDVDAAARTFSARMATTLSREFPAGTVLEGGFEIDGDWIHTGMCLAASKPGQRAVPATDAPLERGVRLQAQ